MAGLETINELYVAKETTFATDPDSTGVAYKWLPAEGVARHKDTKAFAATNYQNSGNWPTEPIATVDGWELPNLKIPVFGLGTAAGDGVAPPAVDASDLLLENAFGAAGVDVSGEGVASSSTTSSLILDTAALSLQELVAIYEANLTTPNRTQWGLVTSVGGSTFGIAPTLDVAPTTAAVAYGKRTYQFAENDVSVSLVERTNFRDYLLLGGKIISAALDVPNGGPAYWSFGLRGDTVTPATDSAPPAVPRLSTHASLPGPSRITQPACLGVRSAFYFGGTKYEIASAKLDLKLSAIHRQGQGGANGRVGARHIRAEPELTIDPLFIASLEDAARIFSSGRVLYQIGGGVLANGRLNTCCIAMETAFVSAREYVNRDGEVALQVTLKTVNPVYFTGSTLARIFQFARS